MSDSVPRLHVDIGPELHRRAKITAARRGLTMKALIAKAVEEYVEQAEAEPDEG
jgi:predicted HicB family RNase H-like nuclease